MKTELIEFLTKDRAELQGLLYRKSLKDIVIFIHGMGGNFYRSAPHRMKDYFLSAGYGAFLINTRGHDLIAKVRFPKGSKVVGTTFEKFEDCLKDLRAAIDTVHKLGFENIYLAGHSTGCQKAAYYASKTRDRRVKGIILLSPTDDHAYFKKVLGRRYSAVLNLAKKQAKAGKGNHLLPAWKGLMSANRFISDNDLAKVEARILNYGGELREFRKIRVPILGVFGGADDTFVEKPLDIIRILEGMNKKFTGTTIAGADHNFEGREKEVAAHCLKWLNSLRKRD